MEKTSVIDKVKTIIMGKPRDPEDSGIFHKLSLIAFFAWVGLGADGLSSACYGPEEAFLALGSHVYLSIFVALGTVVTICIISASYSQIVELFPGGGGGYLVASKLLSPTVGMISGCALLIDYALTITISIASGADAIFSLLPPDWQTYKLTLASLAVITLILMNMRGVKESILPLVPIFLTFLATHAFVIVYAVASHAPNLPALAAETATDMRATVSNIGVIGMILLILRSYSMGAGTFTGIEAVSNGMTILREPRVKTAKHTMRYMAISLSIVVLGLMVAYLLYGAKIEPGKTLNAVLFQLATDNWNANLGYTFVFITLFSEAMLLFVAAQAGFLDGPRVLANMATDRWLPTKFATLSDRLVIKNGILIMGGAALIIMLVSRGSVRLLVVLYSINVFITFVLSQLGMVRHWWQVRAAERRWHLKLLVNGTGLILTTFILISMVVIKFHDGGWLTLLITGGLITLAVVVKRHYGNVHKLLKKLDSLIPAAESSVTSSLPPSSRGEKPAGKFDPNGKTAVIFVSGFNGTGLHTLMNVIRQFGNIFKNFVFIQIGVVDSGNFKGPPEIENLKKKVKEDLDRYVKLMNKHGFYAEGIPLIGVDVVEEAAQMAPEILKKFPGALFFGGQIVFEVDSIATHMLHNYTVFALQKRLYRDGIPFVIMPIRV